MAFIPDLLDTDCEFDLILAKSGSCRSHRNTIVTAQELGISYRTAGQGRINPLQGWRLFNQLRRQAASLTPDDCLAVGDVFFHPFGDALNRTVASERWVLDDGTASWRALQALKKGASLPDVYKKSGIRRLAKKLSVCGIQKPEIATLRWYSIFGRYCDGLPQVYHNSLERLKGRLFWRTQSDEVLLLGSPLVSSGVLSAAKYEALCRFAAEYISLHFVDSPVTYLRHRREGCGEAAGMAPFEKSESPCSPVELRWIDGRPLPRAVVGFMSTALITLAELLPEVEIVAIWTDDPLSLLSKHAQFDELLQLFETLNNRGTLRLALLSTRNVDT